MTARRTLAGIFWGLRLRHAIIVVCTLIWTTGTVLAQSESPTSEEISAVQALKPDLAWPAFVAPQDVLPVDPQTDLAKGVALANAGDGQGAMALLLKAAAEGDVAAATNAGWLLLEGKLVPPDFTKGRALLEQAAAAGDPYAHFSLARMFIFGMGTTQDYVTAVDHMLTTLDTIAAPDALFVLALVEHMATGVLDNSKERCRASYAFGNRLAIEECLDVGAVEGGYTEFAPPRIKQTRFATALAPWHFGMNVEAQYASTVFLDSDEFYRERLNSAAIPYKTDYGYDVAPLLAQIGKSRVRAIDLDGTIGTSTVGTTASASVAKPASEVASVAPAQSPNDAAVDQLIADYMRDTCDVGPASYKSEAVHRKDLTGDGVTDLALDMGFVTCGDKGPSNTCGPQTCEIALFIARDGNLELVDDIDSVGVDVGPETPPRLKLMTRTFEEYFLTWDGSKFSPPGNEQATPGASGAWTYGKHPVLGETAYVTVGDDAIGLGCAYQGTDASVTRIVSLRATPGLVKDDELTTIHVPSNNGGTNPMQSNGSYSEYLGNSCDTNISSWQKGSKVLLSESAVTSIKADGDAFVFSFANGVTLRSDEDVTTKLDGVVVPLKGSSAAINKLIQACPALRNDIEWNCGI